MGAARNEARRAERRRAAAPSTVRGRGVKPIDVTVEDISRTGIRFASDGHFAVGDTISIGLSGVGTVGATVAWAREGLYGCSFVEAITEEAVQKAFTAKTVVKWSASPGPEGEAARAQAREAVKEIYGRHRYWALPIDVVVIGAAIMAGGAALAWHFLPH